MGMSIGASMGMQLAGKGPNSTAASLISEYDKLSQQKTQIEKNKNFSKEEKEKKLQQIEQQMNQLQQQISQAEQKDNAEQQTRNQQREQQKLEDTLPPKVADMVMQMNKMMKTAMNVDSAQSNPDDEQEASEEMKSEATAAKTAKDASATETVNNVAITSDKDDAGNSTVTAKHTVVSLSDEPQKAGREQLTDLIEQIQAENKKASELDKIPEGLLVDEYR